MMKDYEGDDYDDDGGDDGDGDGDIIVEIPAAIILNPRPGSLRDEVWKQWGGQMISPYDIKRFMLRL